MEREGVLVTEHLALHTVKKRNGKKEVRLFLVLSLVQGLGWA